MVLGAHPGGGRPVELIAEVEGLRTTGRDRWGLRWSELSGVAVTCSAAPDVRVRLLLALDEPLLATGAVVAVVGAEPFTHAYEVPASECDPREVEREIADVVRAFAPDLLVTAGALSTPRPESPVVHEPVPAPRLRPSGMSPRRIRTSSRRLQLTLGPLAAAVLALGAFLLYACAFVDNPIAARLVGGAFGLLLLLIGGAGLVTVLFDLTRRIVIGSDGMRLTHGGGWCFTWEEVTAVALTISTAPGDARAPVGLAVAAPHHQQRLDMSYQAWGEVPPFTHLCPVRGGRDPQDLRRELNEALATFVPDLYVGELSR